MSRHSKNPCSAPVFSHAERARLKYGTQRERLGSESQKLFNACEICLHTAESPVLCTRGHIFCRSCVIESLAQQKESLKLLQHRWETQHRQEAEKRAKAEEEEQKKHVQIFTQLDEAVLKGAERSAVLSPSSSSSTSNSSSSAPAGYVRVTTGKGTDGFIVDRELVTAHSTQDGTATKEEQLKKKSQYLPSFWTPSMSPTVGDGEEKLLHAPSQKPTCPGGNHELRLKQLKPVKWCMDKTGGESASKKKEGETKSSSSPAPMCFSCKKRLSNTTPMICNTKCGHVQCKICVDTLMRGQKSTKSVSTPATSLTPPTPSSQLLNCLECDEPCLANELVPIVASTAFAATGNTIAKAQLTPAFRC